MYTIRFYTLTGNNSPIKEFLDSCQHKLRVKILRQIHYVQEYGLNLAILNLKKLTGNPLWELRILGKDNIRLICISLPNKHVMILHIFRKKSNKTPIREINLALKRYKETLDK